MTTYSNSYLPPESQPWARDVEARLAGLERNLALTAQNEGNTLAQLNSAITLLSEQVADIQTSVSKLELLGSTTAATTNGFAQTTAGSSNFLAQCPSLTLTVNRPARVLVTGSSRVVGDAGNPNSNVTLTAGVSWSTNYDPTLAIASNFFSHRIIPGSNFSVYRAESALSASDVISVPAGTLTISPRTAFMELTGGGGTNKILQASPITISAVVLPA